MPQTPTPRRSSFVRHAVAFVITGVGLYVVLPSLARVIASWPRLATLAPVWLVAMFGAEIASLACSTALMRLVLRTRQWSGVIIAGLVSNAVTNVLPGGDAIGAGVQFQMLARSGIDPDQVGGGLAASSALSLAALFALPIFALPALLGDTRVSAGLEHAALLGIIGFVLIVGVEALLLTTDSPLRHLGRAAQWIVNRVRRHGARTTDLADRLIAQRDLIRSDLDRNWWKALLLIAGRIGLDYVSLLAALRATGASANASLVLLAYAATAILALIPITPGGIGIVEASLSGLLVLAGVRASSAVVATLAYRLAGYWLPTIAGGVCYVLFARRYGPVDLKDAPTDAPGRVDPAM